MRDSLQEVYNLLEARGDGSLYLPSFAWPGGYPLVYVCRDGEVVCADCAVENIVYGEWSHSDDVLGADVFYEGPPEYCANCNREIESAYGDPDAEEEKE